MKPAKSKDMSSIVAVKIFYAKGIRVSMKTKTFKEVVECLFGDSPFSKYEPLKMVFTSTGKVLFMDKNAFHQYLSGNITQQELVELTECDELCTKYDASIDRMIELLDQMDEDSDRYENKLYTEKHDAMNAAKDEFFKLFSEYFYSLWD